MTQDQDKKRTAEPDEGLGSSFPRLRHPDLDLDKTDEVDDVANRDEVRAPGQDDDVPAPGQQAVEPPTA
ncbi:hypothetical protein [Amycolatopsis sp. GM8]|uniref:hypothetical protein n=1 Tax=Amycolatopsis sp. GM8 TaxID=2896530 RepID=UPI001F3B50CB|nr:hypothetical protein [Amycolatopsis sp. GM8]